MDSLVKETKVIKSRVKVYYDSNDIYIATDLGTLYVPIKALVEKNPDSIKERMKGYFTDHYKGQKERIEKSLMPLESSQYEYLIAKIKG